MKLKQLLYFYGFTLVALVGALFATPLSATYVYEADQPLIDLKTNYIATSYNLNSGDDQVSSIFNLDFTFTFYGQDFTQAKMATNGCLHFWTSGSSGYCNDYTPDPLPYRNYTLYPFWTDLIRDNGSSVLARNFTDKSVFGWYNLREYNRSNTDNSFEVILWKADDSFEFRYGALNIQNHDVIIGEQGTSSQTYTYLHYDECNTGTTNSSSCVNTNWNASSSNTLLEGGGSLYGVGSGNALDCSNPLNNAACAGYAAAYLTQQCGIDSLYSTSCPLYWEAYDDQQCDEDPQYSPSCAGYTTEASVAYYTESDYGYDDYDDQYGYDEDYASSDCYDDPSYCYDDPYAGMEFTDEEWYAIDLEEFGQDQVDEWYGAEVAFNEDGYMDWDSSELDTWDELDEQMDQYDEIFAYEETYEEFMQEDTYITDIFHTENDFIEVYDAENLLAELEFQTITEEYLRYEEEPEWEEFESIEELEEWFEEEMEEEWTEEDFEEFEELIEEELYAEEIFEEEAVEEIFEDIEELREEELEEELLAEETMSEEILEETELELVINEEPSRSGIRSEQLNVVANSVRAATNSVSGIAAGTSSNSYSSGSGGSTVSSQSLGNTAASGGIASATSGGISTSSSPSMSDQFASATVQTQQVLALSPSTAVSSDSMSAGTDTGSIGSSSSSSSSIGGTEVSITPMPGMDGAASATMVDVQVADLSSEIDTASTGVMTASEADQIADEIIANNIEEQQQQVAASAEESGEYGDQTALVAFIGFNPNFTGYYDQTLPQKTDWYEPREIYADVRLSDNISAFYDMAGTSLRTIQGMINSQPNLLGE